MSKKNITIILILFLAIVIIFLFLYYKVITPNNNFNINKVNQQSSGQAADVTELIKQKIDKIIYTNRWGKK